MSRLSLTLLAFGLASTLAGSPNAPNSSPATAGDFLAQGPLPITVRRISATTGKETEDKGHLFHLTKSKLVYHSEKTNTPIVIVPKKNSSVRVESRDAKLTWAVDPEQGVFSGKVLAPEPIDIKPVAFDKAMESRYLFFSLEHLQEQTDDAIELENAPALKVCLQMAAKMAAHVRRQGLVSDLIRQFEALEPYSKAQQEVFQRGRELFQEAYKTADKLKREEADLQSRRDAGAALGFFQAFISAIPTTEGYSVDRYGTLIEHQSINTAGIASGLGTMMQSQMSYAREQSRLNVAKAAFAQETSEQFQSLQKQFNNKRKERAKAIRQFGAERFQLPKTDPREQQEEVVQLLRTTKDYATLIDLLTQRAKEARGSAPHDYPFMLVEIYSLKSSVPRTDVKKRVEETFALAKQCVAAAKLVPEGAIYDGHRREILKTAAGLALQAAALEIGNRASAESYNFKALYSVRVLDLIDGLGVADIGGDLREMRACALLPVGRKEEALQQAVEVEELRKQSPTFLYNLARLYCAQNNVKEGFRCLEAAVKAGFRDIRAARSSADLAPLRRDKRFNGLTAINAEVKVAFARGGGFGRPAQNGNTVEVVNRSPFALTNVKFRLDVAAVGMPTKTYNHVLDVPLLPNETYRWKDAFAVELQRRPQGVLTIESDQGRTKVAPTAR